MPAPSQGLWTSALAIAKLSWGKMKTGTQAPLIRTLPPGSVKSSQSFPRLLLSGVVPVQLLLSSPAHSWGGGRSRELECPWARSQTFLGLTGQSQSLVGHFGQ